MLLHSSCLRSQCQVYNSMQPEIGSAKMCISDDEENICGGLKGLVEYRKLIKKI